ncbi:hypothetical protein [Wenzhouxiangella sediminis]|uniref:Uncharacterized protein n=1 Tax=Wenzhouxiangella sediminis TaxID=1792836 RepID=A0A3E1K976_9GAMM|nr:hypothetical protein [Wenzhouxiangella sediminis]RFF30618.1 hypothetical protein DZC52_07770 [Wenzhouxiangella sediminis]
MSEFVSRLVGVMMLKRGPQDLPAGTVPLLAATILYVAATALSLSVGEGPGNTAGILLLAVALPLVLTRIVLALRRRPARWIQTVTALFGTSGLLSLLSLPLAAAAQGAGANASPDPILTVASLVLFFWSFAIDGHIWRHALDTSFAAGLAVAVVLFAVSMYVITTLAGPLS